MCVCIYLHDSVCLEPWLQVWVQAAGVWGAPCTCCTEVGGWVSRLGSCDGQWELFGTRTEEHCESPTFLFIHNWTYGYQEYKAFTRVLTVPWEVVKCTPLLQFRMEISPSWTIKDWGLCFTCCWSLFSFSCPPTLVYRDKKSLGPQMNISFLKFLSAWICPFPNFLIPSN